MHSAGTFGVMPILQKCNNACCYILLDMKAMLEQRVVNAKHTLKLPLVPKLQCIPKLQCMLKLQHTHKLQHILNLWQLLYPPCTYWHASFLPVCIMQELPILFCMARFGERSGLNLEHRRSRSSNSRQDCTGYRGRRWKWHSRWRRHHRESRPNARSQGKLVLGATIAHWSGEYGSNFVIITSKRLLCLLHFLFHCLKYVLNKDTS